MPVFGDILVRIFLRMRENTDQNKSKYGHFSRSVGHFAKWIEYDMMVQPIPSCGVSENSFNHCSKSVQIRSFFRSVFFCVWPECRKIPTRKNSVFGNFLSSERVSLVAGITKSNFANLKPDSHLPKKIVLFASMKAIFKMMKNDFYFESSFHSQDILILNSQDIYGVRTANKQLAVPI